MTTEIRHRSQQPEAEATAASVWWTSELRIQAAVAAAVWMAVLWPFYRHLAHGGRLAGQNDFGFHLELARDLGFVPFRPTAPHLLFHGLTRAVEALTPWGLASSGVVVLTVAAGLTGAAATVVMGTLGRLPDRPSWLPALGSILFLVANTPVALVSAAAVGPDGYTPIQLLFNPTTMIALPFVVVAVPVYLTYLDRCARGEGSWGLHALVVAFVVAGMLAKPTVLLLAVVALPIVVVWWRRTGRVPARWGRPRDLAWLLVPAGVVTVLQVWMIERGPNKPLRGGFTVDPFASVGLLGRHPVLFLFIVALPAVVAWARPPFVRARSTQMLLIFTAVAVVQFALLRETGERADGGSLGFAMHACVSLAVMFALAWALPILTGASTHRGTLGRVIVGLTTAAYVVAGLYGYGRWLA